MTIFSKRLLVYICSATNILIMISLIVSSIFLNKTIDNLALANAVAVSSEAVESTVVDAETGQRGFILTGDARYLRPYNQAIIILPNELGRFIRLTQNSPQYQKALNIINLARSKMDELAVSIHVRATLGFDDAKQMVLNNSGMTIMFDIRQQLHKITDDANDKVISQSSKLQFLSNFIICLTILLPLLIILNFFLIQILLSDKKSIS